MKILAVCQYYKPEPFRVSDICETLVEQGHTVLVVTGTPNYPEGEIYPGYENGLRSDETIVGVRVHRCPIHPRKTGAVNRFLNYYSFVFASRHYLRSLDEDFDVVLVNQLSPVMMAEGALEWAKRHGRKVVLYCLDLWPESLVAGGIRRSSPLYRFYLGVSRRIYKGADEICITSGGFTRYFAEVLQLKGDLHYLPQYAEALFDHVPPAKSHKAPYHFLFAGNVGEMQSVETIVEAAKLLRDDKRIHIHIVGDGSRLEQCRRLAGDLSNITFYGRRDVDEMPSFYTMADGLLVTLKDNTVISGTLPGKVQSYMAAARPVIGAIGGETATVVENAKCGCCVPAGDAVGLAQQLQSLADRPEKLRQYGENARSYSERYFRKEVFTGQLTAVLQGCCPEPKRAVNDLERV